MDIKTLKKIKDGLITHQILSENSKIQDPLFIDANYKYTPDYLELYDGVIYFYIEEYKKLVFEIIDDFSPKDAYDVGGISVFDNNRIYNLYQYEDDMENIKYTNIRVTKIINNYYGAGSPDGLNWNDKGNRFIPNANMIGITYESIINKFPLKEIKVYRDPSWYIYGLNEGFLLKVYNEDETEILYETIIDNTNIAKITNVLYPNNFKIKVLDNNNIIIVDSLISNVWGGDEYSVSLDVELYNSKRILLQLEEAKNLGTVKYGSPLKELIYVVNKSDIDIPVTIKIMKDSPAYDWVELEYLSTRGKEIFIPLSAFGEDEFYIIVTKIDDSSNASYELNKNYLFYLEVI